MASRQSSSLFRTAPVDVLQARALVELMADQQIEAVATLHRDDVYGAGLEREIRYSAGILSLAYVASHSYPSDATDFSAPLASLSADVAAAIATYGTASVAVDVVAFDEAREIFRRAKDDAVLTAVKWFASDSTAGSEALAGDADAASFSAKVSLRASTFVNPTDAGLTATHSAFVPEFGSIKSRIAAKLGSPQEYAYVAYDTLWLAVLARQAGTAADPAGGGDRLVEVAADFAGASGPINFDHGGDRTSGDYGFFGLDGTTWKLKAVYLNTLLVDRDASPSATPDAILYKE